MSHTDTQSPAAGSVGALPTGQRLLVAAGALLAAAALGLHFTATALYNTPFNPVRESLAGPLDAYMSPLFAQDWHLFAPNPISEDSGLLVRATVVDGNGESVTTPWADVTTPHLDKLHQERFWPSRVDRLPLAVRQQLDGWHDQLLDRLRADNLRNRPAPETGDTGTSTGPDHSPDPPLTPGEIQARDAALNFAAAVAGDEARRLWGENVRMVQARIATNEYPRFSDRRVRTGKGVVTYYDLDWTVPPKVTP
ncbi:DUF5819 family protein [Kitasatospora sp. NPDC089913]|uniref:DUF5819 family protein n=1 Tax=Kitasatospora sp. NPDC089913 TaxID=3364080 RepID=UPI003809DD38